MDVIFLCGFSFLAGFIDSIVGGGGLIQLPALLLFLPPSESASLATVFGTNKFASICGTGSSLWAYARKVKIEMDWLWPAVTTAFLFSYLGARSLRWFRADYAKPMVLVLLCLVAIYTWFQKDFGRGTHRAIRKSAPWGAAVGIVIGFYDGFFGPGTGSFLIFIFISFFGLDFLSATANAKVINFATNLSAVGYFAATGHISFRYAVPMAGCNMAGALVGTRLAMLKGNKFIRILFLAVVGALIAKLTFGR